MIIGIGTDIALTARFAEMKEGVERRIFTPYELSQASKRARREEYLSSRFASKEAYVKALGTGFGAIAASDIEIRNDESGAPYITLRGVRDSRARLSISHDGDYSVAFVVLENEQERLEETGC